MQWWTRANKMEFITQQTHTMSLAAAATGARYQPQPHQPQRQKYGQRHQKNRRGGRGSAQNEPQGKGAPPPGQDKENTKNGAAARRRHRQHRGGSGAKKGLAPPPQGHYFGYGGVPFQGAPMPYPPGGVPFQGAQYPPAAYANRAYHRPAAPPYPGVFHAPPAAAAAQPSLTFTVGDTPAKAKPDVTPQRRPAATAATTCGPTPNSDAKLRRNLEDVYSSFDCVLMNHAIEVGERAAAAHRAARAPPPPPVEELGADAALAAAMAADDFPPLR